MSLARYKLSPWLTQHRVYNDSVLSLKPAPEYANAEVLLASLCRVIGYEFVAESTIPAAGKMLDQSIKTHFDSRKRPTTSTVDAGIWYGVMHGTLESPALQNQSKKRSFQVTPLIPQVAKFSGSARASTKSWLAGALIKRMILLGAASQPEAQAIWEKLFTQLTVEPSDDIFAKWLCQETDAWGPADTAQWKFVELTADELNEIEVRGQISQDYPAKQFVRDLRAVLDAKQLMTRRQWTSILEALFRIAAVSHVIWLCEVQARIWSVLEDVIGSRQVPSEAELAGKIYPKTLHYMTYGDRAIAAIKDRVSEYLIARVSINALLWTIGEIGDDAGNLSSISGIHKLSSLVAEREDIGSSARVLSKEICEREARVFLCKKGIGSNVMEFVTHVLGQRQTADELLRGYDQGYVIRKRGKARSAQWITGLGPVATLCAVHCALAGTRGARSIHRLSQYLAGYGIHVNKTDIETNDLGSQLRMLGLVLDSPDAESGMLLRAPFSQS